MSSYKRPVSACQIRDLPPSPSPLDGGVLSNCFFKTGWWIRPMHTAWKFGSPQLLLVHKRIPWLQLTWQSQYTTKFAFFNRSINNNSIHILSFTPWNWSFTPKSPTPSGAGNITLQLISASLAGSSITVSLNTCQKYSMRSRLHYLQQQCSCYRKLKYCFTNTLILISSVNFFRRVTKATPVITGNVAKHARVPWNRHEN